MIFPDIKNKIIKIIKDLKLGGKKMGTKDKIDFLDQLGTLLIS
jgi:hypothetical protein